tara:strand:- start:2870 stop:5287 length:2418 start_codon:yes stop_codon:yes gene_type:complete
MFDQTLLKTDFVGRDGFIWWFGRIAAKEAWYEDNVVMGATGNFPQRCKVRIVGYHPFNDELKEEDLPWAQVMMDPMTGGGQGGMGDTLTLVGGETCIGFFLDGEEAQQPVIMGLLGRQGKTLNTVDNSSGLQKSNQFKNFSGQNEDKTTKRRPVKADKVKPPQSPATKGHVFLNSGLGGIDGIDIPAFSIGETTSSGDAGVGRREGVNYGDMCLASDSARNVERKSTKVRVNPSNCKNDAIGQITQVLTDFIAVTNSLENSLGKFVDPIANKIFDMDAELRRIVRQVKGLIKGVMNNIRDGITGKLNVIFSKFLGALNLINPVEFLTDEVSRKAYQKILDIIFCLFEKLLGDLGDFLKNMFSELVENVVNGPFCAAEQFVSGMFAKVFEQLENLMEPVLSGLDWLVGGIGQISEFLGKASNLASQILSFIGCDGRKCTTPSKWASTLSGSIEGAADDWDKQVSNINLLKGVSSDLTRISDEAGTDIGKFFGSDEFQSSEYNGMRLDGVLKATDRLTGGNSSGALNRGLGSIESAISTISLFGGNSIFDSCTQKINNPTRQRDLIGMPIGFVFDKCITPEIEISGKGSGATVIPIVNQFGRIIATQITNRGSGYDSNTAASVIDNTNNGSNAELVVLTKDGTVDQIVVVRSGFGYCPNLAPIPPEPVGIVTAIYVDKPGIGYTSGDSILIPLPRIGRDTINPDVPGTDTDSPLVSLPVISPGDEFKDPGYIVAPVITPVNGSIIDVRIPVNINAEYNSIPKITINSRNGVGANLIPILTYKQLENTDTSGVTRSGLVGITSVIDCI